ncbi:MAG: hypothetical protein QNI91_04520 [Arenicellales bacterium]|nr:hypothetical protein [Arenicellales bacterium]
MSTQKEKLSPSRLFLLLSLCCVGTYCLAAETIEVQVEQEDGAYHIYFEIVLDAPITRVETILSDYENFDELSPGIVNSEILSGLPGGSATVDITLRPCVWILCKTMRKVTNANINAYGAIVYNTIPESSDFKFGKETVIIKRGKTPGQTRVTYNAKLVPKFFVPPLLGSWLIRKHIQQNLEVSNLRVEKLARQQAAVTW